MITCIIIEDQPPAQRILKKYIKDYQKIELKRCFEDGIQALQYLETNQVDLILLDIHLPKISGIEFLKRLVDPPHIIFTTAYSDFALESYELNGIDYLLKPFSYDRFVRAIDKIPVKKQQTIHNESVLIKSGYDHIKINLNDIIFIKSEGDYSMVHLEKQKLLAHETLKSWLKKHPTLLLRTHKSYIINTDKILKIKSTSVLLIHEQEIPIGRAYKDQISNYIAHSKEQN